MDNTVGSLTQFQRSVVIGCVLGDGYLRKMPGRSNAFLEINHSYSQKVYVDWKYSVLQNVCASGPKRRNGNGGRIAYRFSTRQYPEFSELHQAFYRNGRKIVPMDLVIDSAILSVWYMDDGSRCGDSDYYLNTQQFEKSDQELLVQKLQALGLKSSLNRDKEYYRIRLLLESVAHFQSLVSKDLVPTMAYKLS